MNAPHMSYRKKHKDALVRISELGAKNKDLERQLEKAREENETYKYDLETLISIIHGCLHDMSQEECFDTLKQVDDHYQQLTE